MNSTVLDKAYKNEHDVRVKERILLIIRVVFDKQHVKSVAKELHRARSWAYKWYKRYNDDELDGLKDKPRSGRPPFVDEEIMIKIKMELEDSITGWDFRQVMYIIQKRTGVKYHQVHVHRLLHKWGYKLKTPQKRFVRTASQKEKKVLEKEYKRS